MHLATQNITFYLELVIDLNYYIINKYYMYHYYGLLTGGIYNQGKQ